MPGVTLDIKPDSKLHRRIITGVRDRVKFSKREFQPRHDKWRKAEEKTLAYLPERDVDATRRAAREGGQPQYTTLQVPYTYAIQMASHTYWTTVFMSRTPVLQFTGRHGESMQQTQAIEALMDYQVQVGEFLVPLYIWLADVGKYGIGVIGTYWEKEFNNISVIEEQEELFLGMVPTGKMKKRKFTQRVPGYEGNKVYNVRPYDFLPDPRVTFANFQKGEFCGVYNELGWNTILRRKEAGLYINIDRLRGRGSFGTGEREDGSGQLDLPATDDVAGFDTEDRKAGDVVKFYEFYIDLIPSAWGLGKSDMPEKWVFTVTADFEIVMGAQPLGALHNKFPFNCLELEPEGYSIFGRGIPDIAEPIQNTMDWLLNAHFYNVRKVMNDQFIVDPSRVVMKDVQDPLPGGIIRLKPSAYGTDPAQAIKQLQVTDVTQNHMRDMQFMLQIGERALGVNDQIMGVLQQSGRKTATEIRTSSSFGINRLKTTAEYFGAMGWAPWSQMLVQNSQQFFDSERKFKLVGDLALEAGQQFIDVDPSSISGFFDLVPVDGTLPVDRFAQANLWREMLGQLRNFPQIMQTYDMGRIFAWIAQLAGLKNINQFKIEVLPDAQLQQQAQEGNVVPLGGAAPPRAGVKDVANPQLGQVSGVGPTG